MRKGGRWEGQGQRSENEGEWRGESKEIKMRGEKGEAPAMEAVE